MGKEGKKASDFLVGIVDDHIQTAVSLSNVLEGQGFRTFQAYSSEEAIKKIEEEKPDLLLLDLVMKGTSGAEVIKKFPKLKMFAIVSDGDEPEGIGSKNILGVLRKPIGDSELANKTKNFLKVK